MNPFYLGTDEKTTYEILCPDGWSEPEFRFQSSGDLRHVVAVIKQQGGIYSNEGDVFFPISSIKLVRVAQGEEE